MIKEALQYIVGMKEPVIKVIGGETYSDKQLTRIIHNPKASQISMTTLTSLIDYIKSGVDQMDDKMFIQVDSPTKVTLFSELDLDREREYLVTVDAKVPNFDFGRYIEHEMFCISLQSKFIKSTDRDLVLKFAGTVEDGTVAQYGDDGVTQKATVKTGISSKSDAIVPNPVNLKPYRTFQEVDQPSSDFIFRMKSNREIECAIFEADGGAWRNEAMKNIKEYLKDALSEYPKFTIIS